MINIDSIVANQLCTGCGVCISEDLSKTSKMEWDDNGFLVPKTTVKSSQDLMIKVCPFNPTQLNEDEISEKLFQSPNIDYHPKIGYYKNLYVGYSKKFRETSSSGGLATFIFEQLMILGAVQHLFVVTEHKGGYAYRLVSDINSIKSISKTRYTPVTLEGLFSLIDSIEGNVAVSGTACFVKAIRIKQLYNPHLKTKIPFVVGIICGGLKSRFYSDFLAQSAGCFDNYHNAEYRVKNLQSTATDYKFACTNMRSNRIHMVDMQKLGDMWGTGLFKSNACDFCDDVLTELADISLGDAWLQPYSNQGLGNNIVITRTNLAEEIISTGQKQDLLNLSKLSTSDTLFSQRGSFNHRHKGLKFRIDFNNKRGFLVPIKRKRFLKRQNLILNRIQSLRLKTRENSLLIWRKYSNVNQFNLEMYNDLKELKKLSRVNQKIQRFSISNIKRKLKKK